MILEIILSLVIVLGLYLFQICWLAPRKTINFYRTQLEKTKLRYKIMPYRPWYNASFDELSKGIKEGNPQKIYKEDYPQYDIVVTNIFNKVLLQLCSTDFIKDFFEVENNYKYQKIKLVTKIFRRLTGMSLGLYQGQEWKQRRTILNQIFNFDFVKSQIQNIVDVCDQEFQEVEKKSGIQQDQSGRYIELHLIQDLMLKIFSQVILTSFLGIKIKQKHYIEGIQAAQYMTSTANDMIMKQLASPTIGFGEWFYNMEFRKIDKSINHRERKLKQWGSQLVTQKIADIQKEYEQSGGKVVVDDLVKAFVVYRKANKLTDTDPHASDEVIFSQFLGFFMAGTDTTSNFLNMIICNLGRYPQVEAQVRKQVQKYMREDDYSHQNLKNFRYIECVQKQTNRTYGPVTSLLVRQAVKDGYLNGIAVKKGTLINVMANSNHYSEKYFKEPYKFRPQRWMNGQCDDVNTYALMGFGAGARTCLGKHLALLESKIALIKFIKRYKKITLPNPQFKMSYKFMQCPEDFKIKLTLNE